MSAYTIKQTHYINSNILYIYKIIYWSLNVLHMYIKNAAALYRAHINASVVPEETMKSSGNLSGLRYFRRLWNDLCPPIANCGGNGLEWINGSRDVVETCKRLRLRSARFFSFFNALSLFFYRFRSLCSTRGESCSFISAAVVVHCIERSYRIQRCTRHRRIRRHAANELVKRSGFSPRVNVTRSTVWPMLFPNLYPLIFFVNNTARLSIRQKYEICMVLRERGKNKSVCGGWTLERNYRTRANVKIARRYHRCCKQR